MNTRRTIERLWDAELRALLQRAPAPDLTAR